MNVLDPFLQKWKERVWKDANNKIWLKQGEQAKLLDEVNSIGSLENIFFKMQIEIENNLGFKKEDYEEKLKNDKCLVHKWMIQSLRD